MQQSEMKQIELLRSVIYQIIGENRLLLDAIEFVTDNSNYYNVQIEIVYYRDFKGSSKDGKIIMGIPDIVDFYSVAKELFPCLLGNSNYVIETKYSDLGNIKKYLKDIRFCPLSTKICRMQKKNSFLMNLANPVSFKQKISQYMMNWLYMH